jgi:hypothetical protein
MTPLADAVHDICTIWALGLLMGVIICLKQSLTVAHLPLSRLFGPRRVRCSATWGNHRCCHDFGHTDKHFDLAIAQWDGAEGRIVPGEIFVKEEKQQ